MRQSHEVSGDSIEYVRSVAQELGSLGQVLYSVENEDSAQRLGDVESARDVVQLWSELLSNTHVQEDYAIIPESISQPHWLTTETLNQVVVTVSDVRKSLHPDFAGKNYEGNIGRLRSLLTTVLGLARDPARSRFEGQDYLELVAHIDYINMALLSRENQRLARLGERAEAAVTKSEAAADSASAAAGRTGEDSMSSYYSELGEAEEASANTFRWLTVAMSLVAGGAALLFVLGPSGGLTILEIKSDDYVHLAQRGIFIAGVFGLAGYFARQAHQHRSMSNWARSLAVQLKTFDAYLFAVEGVEARDDLRRSFAARAFGDHPAMKGEPTVTPSAAAMDTAVEWAAKLTSGGK